MIEPTLGYILYLKAAKSREGKLSYFVEHEMYSLFFHSWAYQWYRQKMTGEAK